jgi:hypothetical protein
MEKKEAPALVRGEDETEVSVNSILYIPHKYYFKVGNKIKHGGITDDLA